jgi:hypothetical protein
MNSAAHHATGILRVTDLSSAAHHATGILRGQLPRRQQELCTVGAVRVFTMDSVVLGLAPLGCGCCTVLVFRQKSTLEDVIEFRAFAPRESLPCM